MLSNFLPEVMLTSSQHQMSAGCRHYGVKQQARKRRDKNVKTAVRSASAGTFNDNENLA